MLMTSSDYDSMMGRTGGSPAAESASPGGRKAGRGGKAWLLVLAFLAIGGALAYLVITTERQKDENSEFKKILASNREEVNGKISLIVKLADDANMEFEKFKLESSKRTDVIVERQNAMQEQSSAELTEIKNELKLQNQKTDKLLSFVGEQKQQLDNAMQQISDLKAELGDKATKTDLQSISSALEARIAKEGRRISNIEYTRRKEKVAIEDRIKQIDSELLARAAKAAEEEKKPDNPAGEWKPGIPANQGN